MIFKELDLPGAWVIDLEPRSDDRGFFARAFCVDEFLRHGLSPVVAQANLSHNRMRATLRGMHYQKAPHAEVKMVRCVNGAIWDVIIDLRPESKTYLKWTAVDLTRDNHRMLYVPKGFAHGYQTLTDDAEVFYMVSDPYAPGSEAGIRWNDPRIGIRWPLADPIVSPKDAVHPEFTP